MNNATLKPVSSRSPEERRALASKAGRASVRKKRELRAAREVMRGLLALPLDVTQEETAEYLQAQGVKEKEQTQLLASLLALHRRALCGDVRALEASLKLAGEWPADKAEITTTETEPETHYRYIDLTPEQARDLYNEWEETERRNREKEEAAHIRKLQREEEREKRREARIKRIQMYKAGIFPPEGEDEKEAVTSEGVTASLKDC